MIRNDVFNNYLSKKFLTKRFGVEGCDAFVSGLEVMVEAATEKGINHVVIGMPHRGRLNVLSSVLNKPLEEIMTEFQDNKFVVQQNSDGYGGAGDVKYHLGVS